ELLAGLGFRQPHAAFELLERLVAPETRLGKVLAAAFPVMAPALALAANPDAALIRLERVAAAAENHADLVDRLASDPLLAQQLAHVVASSSFATDHLVADPGLVLGLSGEVTPHRAATASLIGVIGHYAAREIGPRKVGEALGSIA